MKKITALLFLMLILLSAVVAIQVKDITNCSTKLLIMAAVDDDDDDFLPPSTPANPLKTHGSNG